MKNWKLLVAVSLFCFSASSWAVIPENGWWWNASESGRGFNIEIQNNQLFFSAFGYDLSGSPMWVVASGFMTSDRDWSGQAFTTNHGQCYGCPYVPPQIIPAGVISLHFTSSQTAVLTVNGVSINVKRQDLWVNEVAPDAMLGEWSAVVGAALDLFDGERIDYPQKVTISGINYGAGYRLGSSASLNPALVALRPDGQWQALLDSSSSFYRLFIFRTTGFNRVEGNLWVYPKGGSPVGSGTFYQAFRTASAAFLQTGTGPASSKSVVASEGMEEKDARLYEQMVKRDGLKAADATTLEAARQMEAALHAAAHGLIESTK